MNKMLRKQWRVKQGKNEQLTGAIDDSQLVKTTEKEGLKSTTGLRKLKEERDTY